jgi:hypothetical protein
MGISRRSLHSTSFKCKEEDRGEFRIIDLSDDSDTEDLTQEQLDAIMEEAAPSELEVLFNSMGVNNVFSVSLFAVAIAIIIANNVLGYGWAREYVGGEGRQGQTVTIEKGLYQ